MPAVFKELIFQKLDSLTTICFLKIDPSQIVYLQALFEGYDGIGVLKTFDQSIGGVCIITTTDMQADVIAFLEGISVDIAWEPTQGPSEVDFLL